MAELAEFASKARVPEPRDRVFKDECVFSFHTSEVEGGLYVCLQTFLGFSRKFAEMHSKKTGNRLFLHINTTKTKIEVPAEEQTSKPTEMKIGGDGGFNVDKTNYEYFHAYEIVLLPEDKAFPIDDALPTQIALSAQGIIAADTSAKKDTVDEWKLELKPSGFAESLVQLDNGVKIAPSGWKCTSCDLTDNLWMNLTDGTILCGRKNYDGSGGNNHAVEHYEKTKYPLCVKLGTITPDGADVFSYAEDDMVLDPHLERHLLHFGINMAAMKKTTATMAEMEIDMNLALSFQYDSIQEAGHTLVNMYGPGLTGLRNLGNSCYLASTMQVLFSLPEVQNVYVEPSAEIFDKAPADPQNDFNTQMAKLGYGLCSGDYSQPPVECEDEEKGVAPRMFKTLIGKGHPEFSTNQQQDALEFFQHVMTQFERNSRTSGTADCSNLFKFKVEQKLTDNDSGQVRYSEKTEQHLFVLVDENLAINKDEVAAYKKELVANPKATPVLPIVPFDAALSQTFGEAVVEFKSPVTGNKTTARTQMRLKTFPKYLVLQIDKFGLTDAWVPFKKDVSLEVPRELDLSSFKGTGLQEGEVEMKDNAAAAVTIDEGMVAQLVGMGFAEEGCKRAVYNNPTSVEAAMEWVFAHMGDADFASPFVIPGSEAAASADASGPTEDQIMMVVSMGFTPEQAKKALKKTDNNVERAVDWIFSHMDELNSMDTEEDASSAAAAAQEIHDGSGRYRLKAIVSHMGRNTGSGHYLCHILKDGQWVIFNDRKVAASVEQPLDKGYLYFFEDIGA